MAKRSLQASPSGIKEAKKSFSNKGWTQEALALEVNLKTRQPIWRFFTGQPVERYTFMEICSVLGLDWRSIALNPPEEMIESAERKRLDIDHLVELIKQKRNHKLIEQCGTLHLLDTSRSVSMDDVYVDLNVLEEISSRRWLEIENLKTGTIEEFDRLGLGDIYQRQIAGMSIVEKYKKVRVLGKPGSGKTTFLQSLAHQCNLNIFLAQLIPVFIPVRDYIDGIKEDSGEQHSLLGYIKQEFLSCEVQEDIEPLLREGRFFLLLDGIDEVHRKDTATLLNEIRRFLERYPDNIYLTNCRSASKISSFKGFVDVEIAPFSQEQIENFVRKWFVGLAKSKGQLENSAQKAEQMIECLNRPENFKFRSLVMTPLFLHLACWIFDYRGVFPIQQAEFYKQCLDILLVKWDQSRNLQRDPFYRSLRPPQKLKLLSEIAYLTFENDDYFFKQQTIERFISEYVAKLPNSPNEPEELQAQGERIFKSIEFQHGVFIERAQGIYSFSYIAFQEYLTARKIVADYNLQGTDEALRKLTENIADSRWREIFLLGSAILKSADPLLLLMKRKIDSLVAHDSYIQEFLGWAERRSSKVADTHPNFPATRGFYLALITKPDFAAQVALSCSLDQGVILDIVLDHICLECTTDPARPNSTYLCIQSLSNAIKIIQDPLLKKSLQDLLYELPNPNQSRQQFQSWWNERYFTWFQNLRGAIDKYRNIEQEWKFSNDQERLLYGYYQANLLLIECLNSGSEITLAVKESIEQSLFLPQKELEEREWLVKPLLE